MEEPQSVIAGCSVENAESKMPPTNRAAISFEDMYKYRGKHSKSSQDGRRKQFLEDMRLRRMRNVDKNRGPIEQPDEDLAMDTEAIKTYRHQRVCIKKYAKKLMFSESFSEVPSDLENLWLCKLCPIGSRRLVLASNTHTIAFDKHGYIKDWFPSRLPCGNRNYRSSKVTLLDCVYNHQLKTYFVLDVLMWNNVFLQECETDFRFFFVNSKLSDDPSLGEIDGLNHRKFINVDFFPASNHLIEERMELEYCADNKAVSINGVLYYHRESSYISGQNPLVGWLQPHELPALFEISVPDVYLKREPNRKERRNKKTLQIEEIKKMDIC